MSITTGSFEHLFGKNKGVYRFWGCKGFLPFGAKHLQNGEVNSFDIGSVQFH